MKPTQPGKPALKAEAPSTDESQTSTSSGAEQLNNENALARNREIEEAQERAKGHTMKESKMGGKPYYTCKKCGFGTELKWQAEQHEAQPI